MPCVNGEKTMFGFGEMRRLIVGGSQRISGRIPIRSVNNQDRGIELRGLPVFRRGLGCILVLLATAIWICLVKL